MAFWKVAGFSQPSPIEQILDKEEYTLEELLDEDDIIQECKSLNGRLIAFLREKKTVEQLLRYLIEPPNDPDDPKKQYRYPFTACEVFCCEVEAVFNTLLEDEELLALLFSLLDKEPPLSCKAAGYFGRVVGQLLLRKTNEMMQHLSNNDEILEKLMKHVDTTSIADIIKRLVGADDHSSMIFLPMHTQWLAETPLVNMLLDRLAPEYSPAVQANAADILTAIAHTQPSALASQLMQQPSIAALFSRALEPGSQVLVTALDVCAALLEPRRCQQEPTPDGSSPTAAGAPKPHSEAVASMLQYVPALMQQLRQPSGADAVATQETPYGVLSPPLGRARLRIVELLAALLRVGDEAADAALISASALPVVQELFEAYPFNNLLHHQMYALLVAALRRGSGPMVAHIFGECRLVGWLAGLPTQVTPPPRPGGEAKGPLRAGYLGHVTRIGQVLQEAAGQQAAVAELLQGSDEWASFVSGQLGPRLELEDVSHWACGRPANTDGGELDSDGDEFQNDMEALEQMQGMPPGMYHRYGVLDDMDDDDDDDPAEGPGGAAGPDFSSAGGSGGSAAAAAAAAYNTDMLMAGMAGLGVNDTDDDAGGSAAAGGSASSGEGVAGGGEAGAAGPGAGISNWSLLAHPGASSSAVDIPGDPRAMDDDAVLLADDDEMGALTASTLQGSPPQGGAAADAAGTSPPPQDGDDIVMVEGEGEPPAGATAAAPQGDGGSTLQQLQAAAEVPAAASPGAAAGDAAAAELASEAAAVGSEAAAAQQTSAAAASAESPAAAALPDAGPADRGNPFAASAGDVATAGSSEAAAGAGGSTPAAAAAASSSSTTPHGDRFWPGGSFPVPVSDDS